MNSHTNYNVFLLSTANIFSLLNTMLSRLLLVELAGVSLRSKPVDSMFPAVKQLFQWANKAQNFSHCRRLGLVARLNCAHTNWWISSLGEKPFSCWYIRFFWLCLLSVESVKLCCVCENFQLNWAELGKKLPCCNNLLWIYTLCQTFGTWICFSSTKNILPDWHCKLSISRTFCLGLAEEKFWGLTLDAIKSRDKISAHCSTSIPYLYLLHWLIPTRHPFIAFLRVILQNEEALWPLGWCYDSFNNCIKFLLQ